MKLRIKLARSLVELRYKYNFLENLLFLPILIMRPDDLVEFGKQNYARPVHVKIWSETRRIDEGLEEEEKVILEKLPFKTGRALVLASGGGREAIFLSQIGYEVTVVDYVPEMVNKAIENANKLGVKIFGLIQDMSKLDVPEASYDIVWLFRGMYSSVPTQKRRLEMLKRIGRALTPEGVFVCQFGWKTSGWGSALYHFFKKTLAFLILGNFSYQKGDVLWCNTEFMHFYSSEKEIRQEFGKGGFEVDYLHLPAEGIKAEAMLRITQEDRQ
jgi:ubiquinone/menaquinone biosynthesis C-methylase UbiE